MRHMEGRPAFRIVVLAPQVQTYIKLLPFVSSECREGRTNEVIPLYVIELPWQTPLSVGHEVFADEISEWYWSLPIDYWRTHSQTTTYPNDWYLFASRDAGAETHDQTFAKASVPINGSLFLWTNGIQTRIYNDGALLHTFSFGLVDVDGFFYQFLNSGLFARALYALEVRTGVLAPAAEAQAFHESVF